MFWQVWKVKDGLVNEWNKNQPTEMQARSQKITRSAPAYMVVDMSSRPLSYFALSEVKGGDAVVAVNGKRGSLLLNASVQPGCGPSTASKLRC